MEEQMRRWLTRVDAALTWAGEAFARLWLLLLGSAILFSFPVAGIALSLVIGWEAMRWIGGGAWTFFAAAYVFGLFLSIYVWSPSVKPTTLKLADLILHRTPN
jgi:hypothetical protein